MATSSPRTVSTSTEISCSSPSIGSSDPMDRVQPTDHVLRVPDFLDIQRAALCSACTYQEAHWVRSELNEYSSVHLRVVRMGERGSLHNLVLASAHPASSSYMGMPNKQQQQKDTLFIAFPGSTTPEDWLVDLDTRQQSLISSWMGLFGGSVPGHFHAGFSRRLKEILPDMHRLRNYIRELGCIGRLVFCGHSLGGALAHMALIVFMISTGVSEASCDHLSIAFGSPHFCDADAEDYLSNEGLSARMFTYINDEDPIPLLLNSMQLTKATLMKFLVKLFLSRLHMSNWFTPASSVIESGSLPSTRQYKFDFAAVWIALLTAFQNSNTAPRYTPVGQQYSLGDNGHLQVLESDYHSTNQVNVTFRSLQKHRFGSYLRSLQVRATHQEGEAPEVQIIHPQITGAVVEFEGRHKAKKRAKIVVTGDNLILPLGFNVSSTGWRSRKAIEQLRWKIANESNRHKVVLNLENEVDPSMIVLLTEAGGAWPTGGLSVSVTTCFGASDQSEVIVKDPWFGSYIKCMFCRCICKLVLMKRCDLLSEHASGKEAMAYLSISDQSFASGPGKFHEEMTNIFDVILDPFINEFTEHRNVPTAETCFELLASCCESRSEPANRYNDSLIRLLQFLSNDQTVEPRKEACLYEMKILDHLKRSGLDSAIIRFERDLKDSESRKIFKVFLAHEHLEKVKTVAFVGPRYAGKSTLINCLVKGELAGRMSIQQSPEVESFVMEQGEQRNVMLVELPGAGDREMRWRNLEHLADLVVVVVSFAGETEDHAEGFAEEARQLGRCDNVIVVVNGVDRVLHGNQEASLWERYHRDYMEDLRRHFAQRAGVPDADVLMSIASPPNDLEGNTIPRLEERNVMLRDNITSSLQRRIYTTTPHPFVGSIRAAPVRHEL